jgi:sortase A
VKSGIIYKPGEQTPPISVRVAVKVLKIASYILGAVGSILIVISILGLVFVYLPLGFAEVRYTVSKTRLARIFNDFQKSQLLDRREAKRQQLGLEGKMLSEIEKLDWEVPDKNYSIYIPKILAKSKVISNVEVGDPKIYLAALKQGVAEAGGLSHPGFRGTTYLFAHSVGSRLDFARYNAVFYLLDKLKLGDEIQVVYQNKLYKYQMADREILSPNETKYLVPQDLSEKLILQTCYPPGTTWKRLVVVATRI